MTVVSKGLEGIAVAQTRIGDVRGDIGQLIYRGYDINELAGKVSFEEVVYLLWEGRLPNRKELDQFSGQLIAARPLPKAVIDLLRLVPKDAPPMHVFRTAVSMLGTLDPDADLNTPEVNRRKAVQLVAQFPSIVAKFHRIRTGKEIVPPSPKLNSAANFLYMLNGEPPSEEAAATMDMAFVLHAEHAFNASTFAARVTIATLSDMYSAITSAIGTLKGPLHGGANEGVIHMLQEIGDESRVDDYVRSALANKKRIMGIGHRVYKTLDPRAPHLKRLAEKLSTSLGDPKWLKMSERIATIMKQEKNLNANVDFYSATVYYSLGIPTDLFTPIFAIARMAGWTAHVLEQLADNRLIRPLSEYIGEDNLKVVPIDKR
ncbi:MAG TPA: citrate synthase [Verrucomicrobiae bacterium]|nr:citrate synthase [Verrucomicrobiae bacterium]